MKRHVLRLALVGMSLLGLSCAPAGPTYSQTPRGPHDGYVAEQTFKGLFFEAVVQEDGTVFVYAYDETGTPADLVQYYPRNISTLELRYPPVGTLTTALSPDRGRGALMARIGVTKARDIRLSPNVVVMLR